MEIGAYDAKTHLPALLKRVAAGESITITRRGRPVAELRPVSGGNRDRLRRAVEGLEQLRRQRSREREPLSVEEVLAARDEGRR